MASLRNTTFFNKKYNTQSAAPGHKQSIRRAWQAFAHHVIDPRPAQFLSEGCRHSITLLKAQRLAWVTITAKRNGYANPLDVAQDMATMAKSAPQYAPCPFSRLDFERIAVDMLHLARERGVAA